MAGCAHHRAMETCARVDYVGIGCSGASASLSASPSPRSRRSRASPRCKGGARCSASSVTPVAPSLLFYIVGLLIYATQVPERLVPPRVGRAMDSVGAGSHALWHVCIVLAMRAHREGIKEIGRRAGVRGCVVGGGM
ncbi:hypothetical protein B0H17DRAFT_501496 [Mycena rosella]|uniref:Uncharacterized protein n=1 Tax=Mycena rosella TaxID=1033263 RepID=A0AAD7DKK1_MYCRO|nr:hypothetical protein B0H17DRAFT_501496 [Mycena rosella]